MNLRREEGSNDYVAEQVSESRVEDEGLEALHSVFNYYYYVKRRGIIHVSSAKEGSFVDNEAKFYSIDEE